MIVAEEVPYLTDGGRQRISCGSREHHLGSGARDLIHRSRIKTAARAWSPDIPVIFLPARSRMSGCQVGGVDRLSSALYGDDRVAAGYATGASPLPRIENCAGAVSIRASRNRRVAEIDSCRHRASVRSNPVAAHVSAATASAIGASCARCFCSRALGSELTRLSRASLTSSSERISRGCATGWRSQSLAACSPLEAAASCERAGPRLLGCFSAAVIRPSCTSRSAERCTTALGTCQT
jgi:hypothetical protein